MLIIFVLRINLIFSFLKVQITSSSLPLAFKEHPAINPSRSSLPLAFKEHPPQSIRAPKAPNFNHVLVHLSER